MQRQIVVLVVEVGMQVCDDGQVRFGIVELLRVHGSTGGGVRAKSCAVRLGTLWAHIPWNKVTEQAILERRVIVMRVSEKLIMIPPMKVRICWSIGDGLGPT
jgi:hypothetical protein